MPNVLAHLGVQGTLTHRFGDLRWVALSVTLPDVPWILQRGVVLLGLPVSPVSLRAYAGAQASLAMCLLLSAALASVAARTSRTFWLLALGCLLHLLLDATQTKWGNGVHLFAPFDWHQVNLGWYWPESPVTVGMTLAGVAFVVAAVRWRPTGALFGPPSRLWLAGGALVALYMTVPLAMKKSVIESDSYSLAVLTAPDRSGLPVAVDRYRVAGSGPAFVRPFGVDGFVLRGIDAPVGARVSWRGRFITHDTVEVEAYHVHTAFLRDLASEVGLMAVVLLWVLPAVRGSRARRLRTR